MPTTTRRPSLLTILPTPTADRWAVALRYTDYGNSNKEYRIVADGTTVHFQWGSRHSTGEYQHHLYPTPAAAVHAARRKWSEKERKGYWPVTGVLTENLPAVPGGLCHSAAAVTWHIRDAHRAATDRLATARPGEKLWLVQAPTEEMPSADRAVQHLARLAHAGKVLHRDHTITTGQYLVVAANGPAAKLLVEVCPVAVEIGPRTDGNVIALTETALTVWTDLAGRPAREALDEAIAVSRAILEI